MSDRTPRSSASSEPTASPERRLEHQRLIDQYCAAWSNDDVASVVACYHPDFVLHYNGRSDLAGDHMGREAAIATLLEVQARTGRKLMEIHDALSSPDHAIVLARERFARAGRTATLNRIFVYHVRDQLLAECWVYDADQSLVDEFLSRD